MPMPWSSSETRSTPDMHGAVPAIETGDPRSFIENFLGELAARQRHEKLWLGDQLEFPLQNIALPPRQKPEEVVPIDEPSLFAANPTALLKLVMRFVALAAQNFQVLHQFRATASVVGLVVNVVAVLTAPIADAPIKLKGLSPLLLPDPGTQVLPVR